MGRRRSRSRRIAAGRRSKCSLMSCSMVGMETFSVPWQSTIEQLIKEHFDLRPAAILRDLDLRRPIYKKTAAYGHFGRNDHDFTWERTDKAAALRAAAGLKG